MDIPTPDDKSTPKTDPVQTAYNVNNPPPEAEEIKSSPAVSGIKMGVGWVVGSGAAKIAKAVIQNNISPDEFTGYGRASVIAASAVLGFMAKDAVHAYTDKKVDAYAKTFRQIQAAMVNIESTIKSAAEAEDIPTT